MFFSCTSSIVAAGLLAMGVAALPQNPEDRTFDMSDKYIITLKDGVNLDKHIALVSEVHSQAMWRADGQQYAGVSDQFTIGNFRAYAGHFNQSVIEQLEQHGDVASVSEDEIYEEQLRDFSDDCCEDGPCQGNSKKIDTDAESKMAAPPHGDKPGKHGRASKPSEVLIRQRGAPWNLDAISHRALGPRSDYVYVQAAGQKTFAYVLDSGINPRHIEFEGRALLGFNAFANSPPLDNDGHGTFIAGIIGGKTWGVAKKTTLVAVKILDNSRTSGAVLLRGLTWAVNDIMAKQRVRTSVINMSIAGSLNQAFNDAVTAATAKGVVVVVPSGNQAVDAKKRSPASAKGAICVAATDKTRTRSDFSNWGPAVKMFAPGERICSAWAGSNNKRIKRASGTAGAGAHVAGLVAYFKSFNHLRTAETTWEFMQLISTKGVVKSAAGGSDLFAYNFSGK